MEHLQSDLRSSCVIPNYHSNGGATHSELYNAILNQSLDCWGAADGHVKKGYPFFQGSLCCSLHFQPPHSLPPVDPHITPSFDGVEGMRFPEEILLNVLSRLCVDKEQPFHPHPHNSSSRKNCLELPAEPRSTDLVQCALVDSLWASVSIPLIWKKVTLGNKLTRDFRIFEILFGPMDMCISNRSPSRFIQDTPKPHHRPGLSPSANLLRNVTVLFDFDLLMLQAESKGMVFLGLWTYWLHHLLKLASPYLHRLDVIVFWPYSDNEPSWSFDQTHQGPTRELKILHGALLDCRLWGHQLTNMRHFCLNLDVPNTALATEKALSVLKSFEKFDKLTHFEVKLPWRGDSLSEPVKLLANILVTTDSFKFLRKLVLKNIHFAREDAGVMKPVKSDVDPLQVLLRSANILSHLSVERCYGLVTSTALRELRVTNKGFLTTFILKDCFLGLKIPTDDTSEDLDLTSELESVFTSFSSTLQSVEISDRPDFQNGEFPTLWRHPILWQKVLAPLFRGEAGSLRTLKLSSLALNDVDVSPESFLPSLERLHIGPSVPGIANIVRRMTLALPTPTRLSSLSLQAETFCEDSELSQLEDSIDEESESTVELIISKRKTLFENDVKTLLTQSPFCKTLSLDFQTSPALLQTIIASPTLTDVVLEDCSAVNEVSGFMEVMRSLIRKTSLSRFKATRLTDYVGRRLEDLVEVVGLGRAMAWEEISGASWEEPRPQISLRGGEMERVLDVFDRVGV
ncbi:hypothetical protein HDU67_000312 [Dinochytrium kinnereticum]|nr:hypothetical protein HDU67_000312 [Dinochytrium kinnereticum]